MDATQLQKRPSCLYWTEIDKWTTTTSRLRFGRLPDGWQLLPVSIFATQVDNKEKVEADVEYRLAGVKWYGEGVFHRETVVGSEQSATYLHPLKPGCVIYNRLFAWKESFAVVPESLRGVYVSNEFPQFDIDTSIAIPEYVYLLFTTKKLIGAVDAASVGSAAVSRNRFKETDFLSFKVPIPPLPVQRRIVAYWTQSQQQRMKAEKALEKVVSELDAFMRSQTRAFETTTQSKVFSASYSNTHQWDIKAGRAAAFISANPDFVRLGEFTEECTVTVRPSDIPTKEWPVYGVSNKDGVFLNCMQLGKDFNAPYKRIEKDWFFHNPTRANVGSLGIVPEVPRDAITSPEYQVWRLKGGLLTDFMALLLRTDYFLALVAFNRVGAVKQRMYYSNLAEIRLPRVPDDIQKRFAIKRASLLAEINAAAGAIAERKTEVEQMILGARHVETH